MKNDISGYLGPMIKHRTVMHRQKAGDTVNGIYYEPLKDEEGEQVDGYYMTRQHYNDFGFPEVITVTAEPGDLLQEDEEDHPTLFADNIMYKDLKA